MAAVGAFVFHLPVYYVYPLVTMDELTKCIIAVPGVFQKVDQQFDHHRFHHRGYRIINGTWMV